MPLRGADHPAGGGVEGAALAVGAGQTSSRQVAGARQGLYRPAPLHALQSDDRAHQRLHAVVLRHDDDTAAQDRRPAAPPHLRRHQLLLPRHRALDRRRRGAGVEGGRSHALGPRLTPIHVVMRACALALVALFTLTPALAQDQLKVAIGQINNWENQPPTLGQDAGIFKRHNLVPDNVGTQGAGETMQPVIAGSADLGAGVGVAGVMRAFARGAPLRILLPAFTGTGDLYWYVKAESPLKTVKDITANNTIPIPPAARVRTTSCLHSSTSLVSRPSRRRPAG